MEKEFLIKNAPQHIDQIFLERHKQKPAYSATVFILPSRICSKVVEAAPKQPNHQSPCSLSLSIVYQSCATQKSVLFRLSYHFSIHSFPITKLDLAFLLFLKEAH